MKLLGKLILWLLVALLLVIVGAWFLLQTHWGARQASAWLSNDTSWQVSLDVVEHDFSSLLHTQLQNVILGREGEPVTLVAKTVDIGLSTRQFNDSLHAGEIVLNDGALNLSPHSADLPFAVDRLILRSMAFNSPETGWALSAQHVTGGVSLWAPGAGNVLGKTAQIQMSAGSTTPNGIEVGSVLIQDRISQGEMTLSALGADVARGTLTSSTKRSTDDSWLVDNLQPNETRLQSPALLTEFFASLTTVPFLQIGRLDITDARPRGPDWAVTNLDLNLCNLTLSRGGWQSQDSTLSMNTNESICGPLHLFDPVLNVEFSPQGTILRQFPSRWEGDMVRTSDSWLRAGNALVLDDTAFAELEYTLPANWGQLWVAPMPARPQSLTLKEFSASRNPIIDVDPAFPWQTIALNGHGNELQLVKSDSWGVWNGNATLNTTTTTFNRIGMRRPSFKLGTITSVVNITELNTFIKHGILQATAAISQPPQRRVNLNFTSRGVSLNILQAWGWPSLPISGDGNFQLTANDNVQADASLKPTINRQLSAVNMEKQQMAQIVRNGEVSPVPAAPQ